mgnify:CR=1 FL=1
MSRAVSGRKCFPMNGLVAGAGAGFVATIPMLVKLHRRFGTLVLSPVYRTRAVGFEGNDFFNAAAVVETGLEPLALNAWLHELEDAHGRDRSGPRHGDRTLDIDIVLFDDRMLEHFERERSLPRNHQFVIEGMDECAAQFLVPFDFGEGRSDRDGRQDTSREER